MLSSIVPTGGVTVALSSSNTQVATVSTPTLTIPPGAVSGTFTITTLTVPSQTAAQITATLNGTAMSTITVDPVTAAQVQSIVLGPPTIIQGGASLNGMVTLTQAPLTPTVVQLSSSNSTLANFISPSVPIAAGKTSGAFTVTTGSVNTQTMVTTTATLNGSANASLTLTPPVVNLVSLAPATVTGGQTANITVTIGGPAPTGGITVQLSSNNPNALVPTTATIPAGASSVVFGVPTVPVTATVFATLSASLNGSVKTSTLTILPAAVSQLTFSPNNLASGQSATGTVTLTGKAPAGGITVNLMSSNPAAVAVPMSITVAAGTIAQTFMVVANSVGSSTLVTVTATSGTTMVTQTLTVLPPPVVRVSFIPANVTGGNTSTGTVTISVVAPAGGVFVSLMSSDPTVTVPAGVTIPAGSTMQTFTAMTTTVATATSAMVSASTGSSFDISGTLTVLPPTLTSLVLNPAAVTGGTGSMGTVNLTGAAPTGGVTINLMSADTAVATVPASVAVTAGSSSATFNVTSLSVAATTSVDITASQASGQNATASLTVSPAVVSKLVFSPASIVSGQTTTGTVTLTGNAPAGGLTVGLSSSNSTAFPAPASVLVPANTTSQTFMVTAGPVGSSTPVTVTASTGSISVPGTVTVAPSVTVTGVTLNPTTVQGGTSSTVTVTLSQAAPAGGVTIAMSSSDPSVTVPASIVISSGTASQSFSATTVGVATVKNVMVTGTLGASNMSGTLTVNPAAIMSYSFSPGTVTGGAVSVGTLVLTGPAPPSGLTVTLMSNNTGAATVPASFNIAGRASSGTFNATSLAVAASTMVGITATLPSGASLTAPLTVNPAVVGSLTFNPVNVISSQTTTGTVTLTGIAPAGGLTVGLSSSNTTAFPVPANVVVPMNMNSQTFMVTGGSVASSTPVTVMATTGTTTVNGSVTVLPALSVMSVTFSPAAVTGGTSSTGTVTLSQAAPAGGITVSLSSGDPSVTVPATATVAATRTTGTFTATTTGVPTATNVMVKATLGSSNASGTLTVNPPVIMSFSFSPSSVTGGNSSIATVVLSGPAPTAGLTITLMSNNTSAATVPASFNIAGSASSGTFTATSLPVASNTPVTITATLPSGGASGGGLTVIPPVVTMLSFSPQSISSGQMTTGTVKLNGNAPTGGLTVNLSSGDAMVAPVPASVIVAAGMNSQTFMVTGGAVSSSTPVTVTATTGATSAMGMLTVTPLLTANPTSLSFVGTQITMTSAALPVVITNNSSSAITIMSITVSGDFGQTNNCPAMLGGLATCTVNVTFAPTQGGGRTGTLTVTGAAPGNTLMITLTGTGFHWVSLTWTECAPSPSCPAVNNFNVYRQLVANGTASCPASGYGTSPVNPSPIPYSASPSYSDIGLTAGATYCYVVTALNGAGQSPPSPPTAPPVVIPSP